VDIMRQSLKLMDCIQKINFYYVFIFFKLFCMRVGLEGKVLSFGEDCCLVRSPLFLSQDNS